MKARGAGNARRPSRPESRGEVHVLHQREGCHAPHAGQHVATDEEGLVAVGEAEERAAQRDRLLQQAIATARRVDREAKGPAPSTPSARVVLSPMTGLDAERRLVLLEGRPPLPFDVASLDVGSTVAGLDLPGVRERSLPTRPIGVFARRVEEAVARVPSDPAGAPCRVVVVGGGAARPLPDRPPARRPLGRDGPRGSRRRGGNRDPFRRRALPEGEDREAAEETLVQVLSGARAALDPLGVTLVGGHTTTAASLLVGFVVDGPAPSQGPPLRMSGLRPGDRLILTKALGTGVLFHADMRGEAGGPWIQAALASMLRGASAVLDVAALRALPGALEVLDRGLRSTAHAENERAGRGIVVAPGAVVHPRLPLLYDPQTSGGLVLGVPAARAALALERLHAAGDDEAAIIGTVLSVREDGARILVQVGEG